jgi:guanylate kinase
MPGVILYGPPAAGKDTITAALHALDSRYVLFPRIKVGGGRQTGYHVVGEPYHDELRARGDVLWENHRYEAIYVVDRPGLVDRLAAHVPVVHLGQTEAVMAITTDTPDTRWLVVSLWCPRDIAAQRIRGRGDADRPPGCAPGTRPSPSRRPISPSTPPPSRPSRPHERSTGSLV